MDRDTGTCGECIDSLKNNCAGRVVNWGWEIDPEGRPALVHWARRMANETVEPGYRARVFMTACGRVIRQVLPEGGKRDGAPPSND